MWTGDIGRAAAAMRTALIGRPMSSFEAPGAYGPFPEPGRMIEIVDTVGKHLQVVWDDGIVLDTQISRKTDWRVYRRDEPWHHRGAKVSTTIGTDDFLAVCYDAADVEVYRQLDRTRHPGNGRLGPDLSSPDADLATAYEFLMTQVDPDRRVRDAIIDARVMRGVGNVYRCEVLWALQISPWAHVGDLTERDGVELISTLAEVVAANRQRIRRSTTKSTAQGLVVYGRTGQTCIRCMDTIESVRVSSEGRMLFWCPGCQTRYDRRQPVEVCSMDPHPAATKYLNDLERARRTEEPAYRAFG